MEALGAVSAIFTVTQLTGKVISIIYDYQRGARNASKQINAVKRELQQLRDVLERLEDLASDAEIQSASFDAILNPLKACQAELQRLETVLTSEKGRFSKVGQPLKWPFKEKEVKDCLDILSRQKSVLQLALTADQSTVLLPIRNDVSRSGKDVTNLNDSFKTFTIDDSKRELLRWLDAPDPSTNHNKACQARQPKTGLWLLNSLEYNKWKTEVGTTLWLHGIPGCGKTILSSTVIEDVATSCRSRPKSLLLYFYFDFNDSKKQELDMFLRSMIGQIARQQDRVSASLRGLYERCDRGGRQPARELLIATFRDNLRDSAESFIVLDALDESTELQPVLDLIAMTSEWQIPNLRLVCTSRREQEIVEAFDQLGLIDVSIQNEQVDADIGLLVDYELEHNTQLGRWSVDIKDEIKTALAKGSQGMFRWAVCQMDALKTCVKPATLRRALSSLPRTLDETYERILKNIHEENIEDVLKMLRWLIYAERPLTLGELAETVAISVDDSPVFDPENRLRHPLDSLRLCSTLVNVYGAKNDYGDENQDPVDCIVRLAHYSVQEYLLSNFNVSDLRTSLSFEMSTAQDIIAKACLAYLLYVGRVFTSKRHFSLKAVWKEYVLYKYAALHWVYHAIKIDDVSGFLIEGLFFSEIAFIIWTEFYNPARLFASQVRDWGAWAIAFHEETVDLDENYYAGRPASSHHCKATYVASYLGFTGLVEKLVNHAENIDWELGSFGTALAAAASQGHIEVLRVLLEHGAKTEVEFSARRYHHQNALQAAVEGGHAECTRLLIAAGSQINQKMRSRRWPFSRRVESPLSIAAGLGHTDVIQVLIEGGADVNAMWICSPINTPLLKAAREGHAEVVQILLANGANVNLIGKSLLAAALKGRSQVAKVLIENGANVNLIGKSLLAAAWKGRSKVAKYLIDTGADVHLKIADKEDPTIFNTPLVVAARHGHKDDVQLLLANGADVNVKGRHGTARETALHYGHDDIAALLPSPDGEGVI